MIELTAMRIKDLPKCDVCGRLFVEFRGLMSHKSLCHDPLGRKWVYRGWDREMRRYERR